MPEHHEIPTAVVVDGPFPNANRASDWEEFPEWTVSRINDDGDDIGKIYYCRSYGKAVDLGERMAKDRGLELVIEASPVNAWGW